jgi:hypothetical protein
LSRVGSTPGYVTSRIEISSTKTIVVYVCVHTETYVKTIPFV